MSRMVIQFKSFPDKYSIVVYICDTFNLKGPQ